MPLPRSRRDALAEQYPRLAPRIHGADREEAAPTIAMLILALLGQGPSAAAAEGALEAVEAVEVAEEGAVVARSLTPAPAATGTPRAPGASGPSVQANQATGNAFRDEVAEALQNAGRVVEKEVYKETPLGKRYIDIEVSSQDGRVLGGVETKVGGSRYTPAQRAKDEWLRRFLDYHVNVVRRP